MVKTDGKVIKIKFTQDEIDLMAEMEHGRWNVERLLNGWKSGPKDISKKVSPFITAWVTLSEDMKEWDRDTVREIPKFLAKVGLEVQRQT
jgi:hypothetical protein